MKVEIFVKLKFMIFYRLLLGMELIIDLVIIGLSGN
jgi:hypothetical protein